MNRGSDPNPALREGPVVISGPILQPFIDQALALKLIMQQTILVMLEPSKRFMFMHPADVARFHQGNSQVSVVFSHNRKFLKVHIPMNCLQRICSV